jgi:hypothetical protein
MSNADAIAEIDDRYGSPGAEATPWSVAWQAFERAEILVKALSFGRSDPFSQTRCRFNRG